MYVDQLLESSRPFLGWAVDWYNSRPTLDLAHAIEAAQGADRVALMAVDVTVGFCSHGALASDRVGAIVEPIARLFQRAYALGVRHFVLPQDTHLEDAVEFESFPPHCVRGTAESETVAALRDLPLSDLFIVMEKNSVSTSIGTELEAHREVKTFLVTGDCTDFCTYQLAMHLRLRANAFQEPDVRVIVPLDGVDTFHIPVDVAEEAGILPHHADLMHLLFLFNLAANGVEVVTTVR
jgi:nicotinamidase-related amidase